jgi:hypothetical protein
MGNRLWTVDYSLSLKPNPCILNLQLLSPDSWQDYELIDSGAFEKLERFGKYLLIRPEPQGDINAKGRVANDGTCPLSP